METINEDPFEEEPHSYVIEDLTPRKDSLLNWKAEYTIPGSIHYDYHQETLNIASTTRSNSSKKSLFKSLSSLTSKRNAIESDFAWKQQSIKSFKDCESVKPHPLHTITCHTTTDTGDSLIMIGGMSRKLKHVTVLEMKKNFSRVHALTNIRGNSPCCRWGHAASYIAPLHAIVMTGGFDSTYNWNDIRLLRLWPGNDWGEWYQIEPDQAEMGCRALHSSTVRYTKVTNTRHKMTRKLCEVYIFGGQYCSGGPYVYNNSLFRIQFYDELCRLSDDELQQMQEKKIYEIDNVYKKQKHAFVTTEVVETCICSECLSLPPPRSQHFAWIDDTNDRLWIYGGLNAGKELNDCWYLNLITKQWSKVKYAIRNVLNAPTVRRLNAHDFRLNLYGDKFYYSVRQNKLVIMHCVDRESPVVRGGRIIASIKTNKEIESVCEGKEVMMKERDEMVTRLNKLKDKIYWMYTLDLECNMWDLIVDEGKSAPKYQMTGCQVKRIGDAIWMIGGKDDEATMKINRLNNIIGIKIPTIGISWQQERVIWIAHLKNDHNERCLLKCLAKELIVVVLLFSKQNVW
eukprot:156323_1